jgi:hypothetical protein
MEKLTTPHNEQILIDMRNEGISPKAKMPKHWQESTLRMPNRMIGSAPPGCGNCNT